MQLQHFQEGHLQLPILCSVVQDGSGVVWSVCMEDESAVEARRVVGGSSVPQNANLSDVAFQIHQTAGLLIIH